MEHQNEQLSKEFLSKFKDSAELDDFFSKMYKDALQKMLEGELDNHLGFGKSERTEAQKDNYRNGHGKKKIKTTLGELEIMTPRDRNSSFDPVIVEKRQSVLGKIEDVVLGLYSKGMSVRDIEQQVKELYGISVSDTEVSRITNRLLEAIKEWQTRPLDAFYPVLWIDAIHINIKDNYQIKKKAVYIIIGLKKDGYKEPLGLWIESVESSTFWMKTLDDLKARGVNDILLVVSDNLTGLTKGIKVVFPACLTQLCIVHQIRNSLLRVAYKDKKDFAELLKDIYKAPDQETARKALEILDLHFGKKYPWVIKAWERDWDNLMIFLEFPMEMRKFIYTTNIIENVNRNIRKYTKNRTMFPNDDAAIKAVYLTLQKQWLNWKKLRFQNWQIVMAQVEEYFPGRF